MQLLNVTCPRGVWTQVYGGANTATIGISPGYGYVCQSDAQPANGLIGFPIINRHQEVLAYVATPGSPVWVKALDGNATNGDAIAIVNA
ncbi:hypothetical protein [Serratia sp. UGAL515B_01]|uniref:hypothetical protein n=1 Tax=Serratia sp. UGAL515B_01 TaxID=2986763 RepID=UPI0029541F5E|nr:hypothetical protein [Serratia sp. UGAL515B_01]WON77572.1 hypothetical protein OK023_02365 [Serratia sp. UGAL515B_01]